MSKSPSRPIQTTAGATSSRQPGPLSQGAARRLHHARRHHDQVLRRLGYAGVGLIAVGLIALAIALPSRNGATDTGVGASSAGGPAIGSVAPDFSVTDVVSGGSTTLASLAGHKTLLFFSEGVGCQACMVQAAQLGSNAALSNAGIKLVSITTDAPGQLAQAASEYGIRTPLLADSSATMSSAYGMLGHGGMGHPTQDGHAFMLIDTDGKVLWHRAYQSMYVNPDQLLSDMGVKA